MRQPSDDGHDHVRSVGDQRVDAPVEQPAGVLFFIHGPDLHAKAQAMRRANEARRYDAGAAGVFGHLIAGIGHARNRPPAPGSIQRPPDLFARRARRNGWGQPARRAEHPQPERSKTDPVDRPSATDHVYRRGRERRIVHLQFDDDWHVRVPRQHVGEHRHADPQSAKRKRVAALEVIAGIRTRQLVGSELGGRPAKIRRPLERTVVVNDDDPVAREADVELEAVGAQPEPLVERRERVLWSERAASPMREHQPAPRLEETVELFRWSTQGNVV